MAKWIEIPACRILMVTYEELHENFDLLDENGNPSGEGCIIYRVVRKSDSRVFKFARFKSMVVDGFLQDVFQDVRYLEEV